MRPRRERQGKVVDIALELVAETAYAVIHR